MFGPKPAQDPSPATTLTPGPDFTNTLDPEHYQPERRPATIDEARRRAHAEARSYFLWNGRIHIAVDPYRHLETSLTAADIAGP